MRVDSTGTEACALTVRAVKVHKLNEMGEIVDKKGHRAWEMACGLQLGIRVMVSRHCMCVSASVIHTRHTHAVSNTKGHAAWEMARHWSAT